MIGKGVFEFEDGKIGFKFGMIAAEITEKESGCSISEVFTKITEQKGETTTSLLNYFYGAAVAWARSRKETDLPDRDKVADWIDSIGITRAIQLFHDSVSGPGDPNAQAPAKGQNNHSELSTSLQEQS